MSTISKSDILLPSWSDRLRFIGIVPIDWFLYLACRTYRSFLWGFQRLNPRYMAWTSRISARRAFYRAVEHVPAYATFVAEHNSEDRGIPETDKERYIKAFPTELRCLEGRIPSTGTLIDESSGSTGTPFNWVRSNRERIETHIFVSYFATYCFGLRPWITINAFSMGAWATGLNVGLALQRNSIVKNTGPDVSKILSTLAFFGTENRYLMVGYPPFLKRLIDEAHRRDFPLADYRLNALVGGEGMTEGLRDYLLGAFQKVFSGYGASDLEIGIAGETPLSVAIRRLARDDKKVRETLFGADSRLPMLFQYNPLMHFVEINDKREVVITITRPSVLSPRIRYNIHDEGGIGRFDEIAANLPAAGHDVGEMETQIDGQIIRLPFLWIYGRRDFTISIMGANIYPEDLEQAIYADPELARITRSFCQSLSESVSGEVRPCFHFEIDEAPSEPLKQRFSSSILNQLLEINTDFREAWHEYPETMIPEIHLHSPGGGPFGGDAKRIKQIRHIESFMETQSNRLKSVVI